MGDTRSQPGTPGSDVGGVLERRSSSGPLRCQVAGCPEPIEEASGCRYYKKVGWLGPGGCAAGGAWGCMEGMPLRQYWVGAACPPPGPAHALSLGLHTPPQFKICRQHASLRQLELEGALVRFCQQASGRLRGW